jgi:2-polyprenyl-3-methyl-5-hydroxy-6-metoxy-1,4-benzoquinol methylase
MIVSNDEATGTEAAVRGAVEHFDGVATTWIRRYADRPSFRHRLVAVGAVVREVVARYDRPAVLDFGGGPGVFSLVASEGAGWVLCLDVSARMIRAGISDQFAAESLVRSTSHRPRPERVHRMVGTLEALRAQEDPAFDVVLAVAVLEYLPDPAQVVTALATRLGPGGRLVLTVPNERSWFRRFESLSGSLGAGVGSLLHSERLMSRAYASTRPHGNRVMWRPGADAGGLLVERIAPLTLAASGFMAHVNATHIVVLQKRPRRSARAVATW